ncbi:MAG: hypothetical protein Q8P39_03230 [Candidatus Yanofskybacteria bacterium]|nr:hypothetical protein [Candidatus Yanofskybacteria bacterium]
MTIKKETIKEYAQKLVRQAGYHSLGFFLILTTLGLLISVLLFLVYGFSSRTPALSEASGMRFQEERLQTILEIQQERERTFQQTEARSSRDLFRMMLESEGN